MAHMHTHSQAKWRICARSRSSAVMFTASNLQVVQIENMMQTLFKPKTIHHNHIYLSHRIYLVNCHFNMTLDMIK